MKSELDDGGERILLGDDTGRVVVMLRPIRFPVCSEFGFQLDSLFVVCIYVYTDIYIIYVYKLYMYVHIFS
jgi:hypothetical protein